MKKILLSLSFLLFVLAFGVAEAQTFTMQADTVKKIVNGSDAVHNNISIPGSAAVTIKYHIIASDFPADWLTPAAFGLCDGTTCLNNSSNQLWNMSTSSGNLFTCIYPASSTDGNFDLTPDLTTASTGTHYVKITLYDNAAPSNTKDVVFVITKNGPVGVQPLSSKSSEENIVMYPNPATNELNVVYDASYDIKNIAVYNIIGKMMNVYKVAGNSANLNIENIPSGIYFVKLYNANGNAVLTRKFTKQ